MQQKISISNLLILFSLGATFGAYIFPSLYQFGMSQYFLQTSDYFGLSLQFLLYSFLHGGVLHLAMNSLFIYYFGNQVEHILGVKKYLIFFLENTVFIAIMLLLFSHGNTVGISGFALAALTYYTLHLRSIGNPEYTGGITAIIINIIIGFTPGISLLGHLFGAVFGVLFFYGNQVQKKRS